VSDGPGATPLPITFLGLAIATTVYAGFETQILPKSDFHTVGWIVVAMPVPMQLLAAIWGLIRGELAAATGSAVLATTWLAIGLATITGTAGPPGPTKAEGLLLFAAAAGMLISTTTEVVDRSFVAAAVMLTTTVRFALTGVSGFTQTHGWTTTAGVAGFVLAGVAIAGAFTIELRSALGRRK
jgi:succinate-acetate transporter protein